MLGFLKPQFDNPYVLAWRLQDMETGLSLQAAPTQYPRQQSRPSFSQIVTSNSNVPEDVNNYFSSSSQEGA